MSLVGQTVNFTLDYQEKRTNTNPIFYQTYFTFSYLVKPFWQLCKGMNKIWCMASMNEIISSASTFEMLLTTAAHNFK